MHLDRLGEVGKRACPKLLELMMQILSVEPEKRPEPEEVVSLLK